MIKLRHTLIPFLIMMLFINTAPATAQTTQTPRYQAGPQCKQLWLELFIDRPCNVINEGSRYIFDENDNCIIHEVILHCADREENSRHQIIDRCCVKHKSGGPCRKTAIPSCKIY